MVAVDEISGVGAGIRVGTRVGVGVTLARGAGGDVTVGVGVRVGVAAAGVAVGTGVLVAGSAVAVGFEMLSGTKPGWHPETDSANKSSRMSNDKRFIDSCAATFYLQVLGRAGFLRMLGLLNNVRIPSAILSISGLSTAAPAGDVQLSASL